jgi:hypothetical protein
VTTVDSKHAHIIVQLSYSLQHQFRMLFKIQPLSMVEAAGVEPASENVTGQENYMLSRVHAPGITLGRSRSALRTDKKRVSLACDLSLASQT